MFNSFNSRFFNIIPLSLLLLNCSGDSNSPSGDQDLTPQPNTEFNNVSGTNLISNSLGNNSMDGVAIDIDNDGDTDMILAMEFRRNIILINDGQGRLTDESNNRFPNQVHDSEDIAIADFDKDNDPDIVFVSEDDQTNEYYRNNGQAVFTDVSNLLPVSGTSNVVETADFNNDTYPDLIIGNRGQNIILINDQAGGFTDETAARLPVDNSTTQDIELADINGDGNFDIIEANETSNRILINDGNGNFTDETATRLPPVNDQTREVELADIDNDNDLDIFFANVDFGGIGNPQNRMLLNDGNGNFSEITSSALPVSNFRTVGAIFYDINDDGFIDLISGNRFNSRENLVLINDGNRSFSDQTTTYFPSLNSYAFDFQLADFNGDGKTDIYFCNFQGNDILLFGSTD
ncbi:hypothetical protein GWK08_17960 [Leptobacterium flavescens]|uniref:VCBS repeat-containing protein n=1 Tax=Leptobacterium flavescens TaxID=472055 RepID=A0A6P0UQF7_9FLAO|nr:VCBS repeat-containing protein [Leptobacterium flavescens]NER15345.1 hypothetical protein [Leptobacterium flavescens]